MSNLLDKKRAKIAAKKTALKKKRGVRGQTASQINKMKIEQLDKKWNVTDAPDDEKADIGEPLPDHLIFGRRPRRRQYIAGKRREELSVMMPALPPPDVDYHIVAAGRGKRIATGDIVQSFGFGNFIDFVTDEFGDGCVLYIATWSMNRDHALMLLELLDNGRIGQLNLLCDPAFTMRKHGIMLMLKNGIGRFDGSRYKMAKNHSKITCIRDAESKRFCTITGSANLSGTPRAENYTLSTDPGLYRHFVENFFEVIFLDDRGGVW